MSITLWLLCHTQNAKKDARCSQTLPYSAFLQRKTMEKHHNGMQKQNAICVNGPLALQYSEIKYRSDLILWLRHHEQSHNGSILVLWKLPQKILVSYHLVITVIPTRGERSKNP